MWRDLAHASRQLGHNCGGEEVASVRGGRFRIRVEFCAQLACV